MDKDQIVATVLFGVVLVAWATAIYLVIKDGPRRLPNGEHNERCTLARPAAKTVLTLFGLVALVVAVFVSGAAWPGPVQKPWNSSRADYKVAEQVASYANTLASPGNEKRIVAEADRSWRYVDTVADIYNQNTVPYGYHGFKKVTASASTGLFSIVYPGSPGEACVAYNARVNSWYAKRTGCR